MNINRCVNCMEDMENVSDTICPRCHFDNARAAEAQSPYAMRQNSILHGRYLIGNVLGQGGFGITYIAFDLVLSIKVAIKEYFPMGIAMRDPGSSNTLLWHSTQVNTEQRQSGQESFLKEARRIAKIDQIPSIVRVRDTFFDNDTAYIVMDFVEGITLKDKLLKGGSISFSECMRYLAPMMEGLAQVHKAGIIHRDISPDNIIIQANGSVKLLDLGAAKDIDISTGQGQQSQLVAKKGFSPLEQYTEAGRIGPWTDVYALCATIYYSVTGKMVPNALDRIGNEEIPFPEGMKEPLAAHVRATLQAGLALEAGRRIQSVEELLTRLRGGNPQMNMAAGQPGSQAGKSVGRAESKAHKPKKWGAWIGAAAAVFVMFVIVIAAAGGRSRKDDPVPATESVLTTGELSKPENDEGGGPEDSLLVVESLGTSNANLLNDGGNVLFAGDYEYFLTADSSLYVCKYNQDKNNSYVNSGDKVCDTALYLTLGSDKIYFLSTVNGHSAVCQADQNGDNFVQLYPVTGRQELRFLQYVKFSDHREYLYFLMENVAGEMGASLYRCDLSGSEVELLIEGNLIWYNLYKDSVYYTCMQESAESFEVLLMRAGFDGQGEEILNADKQFLYGFAEEDALYLFSGLEEALLAYNLDGTPKEGYEGLGNLAINVDSASFGYGEGWIFYTGTDGNIHRVRGNGIGDSVVLREHGAQAICYNDDWIWFYEETDSEKDFRQRRGQTYFAKYDGGGLVEVMEADYFWGMTVAREEDFQYKEYVDGVSAINISGGTAGRQREVFDFGLGDTEAIVITGYTGELTDFEIPKTIDGKLVVGIGEKAFYESAVEEIGFPKGLRFIEESAFQGCTELKYVNLPEGLEFIGSKAFRECSNLTSAILPEGLKRLENMVFMDTLLSYANIPSTVEYISVSAFSVLPGSGLVEFKVSNGNDKYWEWNGALYETWSYNSDDEGRRVVSELLIVPTDYSGALVIAEGVEEISDYAFFRCEKLTEVTIPTSVVRIGEKAFKGVTLQEITISRGCELPSDLGSDLVIHYY